MSRRLATILAADAVGFSAQMEKDEESTLAKLKGLRQSLTLKSKTMVGGFLAVRATVLSLSLPAR